MNNGELDRSPSDITAVFLQADLIYATDTSYLYKNKEEESQDYLVLSTGLIM